MNDRVVQPIAHRKGQWQVWVFAILFCAAMTLISTGALAQAETTVWTWGMNNAGQLGNGTNTDSYVPVQVSNLTGITAVASGSEHCLALMSDGTIRAWGSNWNGQLGNGTRNDSNVPVQVSNLTGITAIAAGDFHSLALKSNGTVWAWGMNSDGQLGNGTYSDKTLPVQVSNLTDVIAIAAGEYHSLALKSNGILWAWGMDSNGQLGNGQTDIDCSLPQQVLNLTGVTSAAGGGFHSAALDSLGAVWTWGWNDQGQLGTGTTTDSSVPVPVTTLGGITAITGMTYRNMVLQNNGSLWAWGGNEFGQLGNGTTTGSRSPVHVSNLTGVIAIGGGEYHSLALRNDGTLWSWGYNYYGQLGNGTTTDSHVPIQVPNLTGIVSIAPGCGSYHSIVIYSPLPPETAGGDTLATAQTWSDKNTQTWPANPSATSYRIYRGQKADLPNLLNSTTDSCRRYEGTDASATISDDPTTLGIGDLYWYLVVGVNSYGEGPGGNALAGSQMTPRIVNGSATCP